MLHRLWLNGKTLLGLKSVVLPVSGGGALRKIIVKAHCAQVKEQLRDIVGDNQLGVREGGYETGVHVMRELAKRAMLDGGVILLVDFADALNAWNGNLLIKLVSTFLPEVATLAYWLYAEEADLHLSNGDKLLSSEGGQQGCGLMNLLFALIMKYVMKRIEVKGIRNKGAYWDDLFVKGNIEAVADVLSILKNMEKETNLKLRVDKCRLRDG